MTFWSLVFANLLRSPTRLCLTTATLIFAFLLFGLMQSISAKLASLEHSLDTRLVVGRAHPFAYMLPLKFVREIQTIEGVRLVTPRLGMGCRREASSQNIPCFAVYPQALMATLKDVYLEASSLERFTKIRTGAVVTDTLAKKHGWRLGDAIPMTIARYKQDNGSNTWEFELTGILSSTVGVVTLPEALYFSYAYFDEAAASDVSTVGTIQVIANSPKEVDDLALRIDDHFSVTSTPTMTLSQAYRSKNAARRLGDLNQIITLILSAAFFSVLIVSGNTAIQSVRDRTTEFATMQALGFGNPTLSILVFIENLMLCIGSAVAGIIMAYLLTPVISTSAVPMLGYFGFSTLVAGSTMGAAISLAVVISVVPLLSVWRRSTVDGLRSF